MVRVTMIANIGTGFSAQLFFPSQRARFTGVVVLYTYLESYPISNLRDQEKIMILGCSVKKKSPQQTPKLKPHFCNPSSNYRKL